MSQSSSDAQAQATALLDALGVEPQSQPPALPTAISRDDMHTLMAARQGLAEATSAVRFTEKHIAGKYQLGPNDRLLADGTIQRGA